MRCVVDGQAGVAFGVGKGVAAFDDAEGVFAGFAEADDFVVEHFARKLLQRRSKICEAHASRQARRRTQMLEGGVEFSFEIVNMDAICGG